MSNKVKCLDCENMMFFAVPSVVDEDNYEYAKHCLEVVTKNLVCGSTCKTKPLNNEQYCKHFEKRIYEYSNEEDVERLKRAIAEYEKQLVNI